MPELPEVETICNDLKKIILNKQIKNVYVYHSDILKNTSKDSFINELKNEVFLDIKRIGKNIIFILKNHILISHLRMEGKYFLKTNESLSKHEHIVFLFNDNTNLRYHDTRKFGTMHLFNTNKLDEVRKLDPLNKLGLDPILDNITLDYLKEKLNNSLKIKANLLDQSIICGIGNIYADEILIMSHILPFRKSNSLTDEEILLIIKSTKEVLDKAIMYGGTTIRSFMSLNQRHGTFSDYLLIHNQRYCNICHNKVDIIKVGGRTTYYCNKCQK